MKLQMNIEELIHQEASDFEVAKIIKKEIQRYLNSLEEVFKSDQGKNFLVRHTKNLDKILSTVYRYILRTHFKEYLPLINSIPVSIIALGSYGREQLCVYSDIDLLIVYKEVPAYNILPIIESTLQILWDSGLKLGHHVHEIETLFEAAQSDHTIKTAFLESRFICGSKYLWMESESILNRIRRYKAKEFIKQKLKEREESLKKYPLTMQPDIKSSEGGLRDANTLFWIAKTLFNVSKIKDLPTSYISESEYKELMMSLEFLYRLRSALHLSSGKKSDKLLLELIPDVADKLHLSQTKTVQKTFEAMHHIHTICSIVTKRLTHTLFVDPKHFKALRQNRKEKNLYCCTNTFFTSMHITKEPLLDLIEKFIPYCNQECKFDVSVVHYFKKGSLYTMQKQRLHQLLKTLFETSHSASLFLTLYRAHHLYTLIAPLRKVAYLPQFDGYHTHPVDLHSIYTLKALEEIVDTHVKELYEQLSKEERAILHLSAFLHDCGKGRKKDHSILGAAIIKKYALELGFSKEKAQLAHQLVKYHTLMSNTAHREDIYSEKVIYSFIAKLQNIQTLKLLYILTYADISSVSKSAYSANNARLLYTLYQLSLEAFENRVVLNEAAKRNKKEKSLRKLANFTILPRPLQKRILSIESNLLFLKFKPDEIIDIASWVWTLKSNFEYRIQNATHLRIDIIRKESVNLGYILSKLSTLNVVSMDIYKIFNDVKFFRIEFEEKLPNDELYFIEEILKDALNFHKKPKPKVINIKLSDIKIDCNHSKTYAKMKLHCADQKGILANIMTIFDDIGIDIASAKIQTIKNRARNLFLIEKNNKFCTNQKIVVDRLISNR